MSQTPFIQAWDAESQCYVVFKVSTGEEIERRPARYKGLDEVDPLPAHEPERARMSDPLAGFR